MLRRRFILPVLALCLLLHPETVIAVDLVADSVTRSSKGVITAVGDVLIQRGDETVAAEKVIYDAENGKIEVRESVIITSKDSTIKAESGELHTSSKTGELHDTETTLKDGERLRAQLLKRDKNSILTAVNAIFTSCPADAEAWKIKADYIKLDQDNGLLTARNTTFELAGTPVFYTPYWQQALHRKSGLLMPTIATGRVRGNEVAIPYYFAPARNWDATVTPRWMTKRGLMGELELRHRSLAGYEKLQIESVNDKLTSRQRGRIRADIQRKLPYKINFSAKADYVSDYNYLADFVTDSSALSNPYLQSEATLSQSLAMGDWQLFVRNQQDLTLPSNAATLQILPRFESSFRMPLFNRNAVFNFDQQSTLFSRITGEDGWRIDLNPYLEIPWQLSGGGLRSTLNVGVRHTRYWLKESVGPSAVSRNTFEASLDTRASFERISDSRLWRHTIAPVLRYDFIAAPDQSNLPNFDSSFGQLSMSNLLTGNRFTGRDRIERLNRISFLVESGLQYRDESSATARDIMNAKLGAAYEMRRESVDPAMLAAVTRPLSNLLGEVAIYPWAGINITANGQYNPVGRYWATAYTALNMDSQSGYTFNLSWQRTDSRYAAASELITADSRLNIAKRWDLFGRWQYDPRLKMTQQLSSGIDYLHSCWNLRIEGYRYQLNGTNVTADTGVRFLLGFKGLGSVGG